MRSFTASVDLTPLGVQQKLSLTYLQTVHAHRFTHQIMQLFKKKSVRLLRKNPPTLLFRIHWAMVKKICFSNYELQNIKIKKRRKIVIFVIGTGRCGFSVCMMSYNNLSIILNY